MGGCGTQGTQFGLHLSSLGPLMIFQLPNFSVKKNVDVPHLLVAGNKCD